ncbi:MAG: hypothetical protein KF802_03665 [Bdellovibrionaceae bacterium]|nr:hypothetical protein [Pseudobdellovibrionaceae bacterium]MBX3033280.1 hypothetical protein [Pseudobdellovibrionaceae bacterium]
MKKLARLALIGTALALPLLYQNCARVELEQPSIEEPLKIFSGTMKLCLDGSYSTKTIESASAYNLNVVNRGRGYQLDSDGDGLTDNEELRYGFDPRNRRSNGKYLDKICLDLSGSNDCGALNTTCSKQPNMLGLSDCDWQILGLDLVGTNRDKGLDSDNDGMTDLIELLRGTQPNVKDDLDDPDHDLVRNFDEIRRGSNVLYFDEPFSSPLEVKSSLTKKTGDPSCAGESWEFRVDQLTQVKAPAVRDDLEGGIPTGGLTFTRGEDENTAVIILKLQPQPGQTGEAEILIRPVILGPALENLDGTMADFVSAGRVDR